MTETTPKTHPNLAAIIGLILSALVLALALGGLVVAGPLLLLMLASEGGGVAALMVACGLLPFLIYMLAFWRLRRMALPEWEVLAHCLLAALSTGGLIWMAVAEPGLWIWSVLLLIFPLVLVLALMEQRRLIEEAAGV